MSTQPQTTHGLFVFGSDLSGRHDREPATIAVRFHGAEVGTRSGLTGNSYAIPYRNDQRALLPLDVIESYVDSFIEYAKGNSDLRFEIARFGCESDTYTDAHAKSHMAQFGSDSDAHSDEAMAGLFAAAPPNCQLPGVWSRVLEPNQPARLLVLDPLMLLEDSAWYARIARYLTLNEPLWNVSSVELVSVGHARTIVAGNVAAKALKLKHRIIGQDENYFQKDAPIAAEYKAIWYATHMLSISDFDVTGDPQQIRAMRSATNAGLQVDYLDASSD